MQVGQRREGERKVSNFGKSLPSPDFSSCYVENCREGRREEVGHRALFPLVHQPLLPLSSSHTVSTKN